MPPPGRSPVQQGRQKKTVFNYILLGSVTVVLLYCGTFLVLHFLSRGFHGRASILKNGFNSGQKPNAGLLESDQCPAVCYTKECLRTAAEILEMLDPVINPCEDFSAYACGGYNGIPTEYSDRMVHLWSTEDEAVKVFGDLIKEIPKSLPENTLGTSLSKLRIFYDSCINTEASEENSIPTALKYLEDFGIYPWPELNNDFVFRDPDLDEALVRMAFYNQNPFFRLNMEITFLSNNDSAKGIRTGFKRDRDIIIMMRRSYESIFHSEGKLDKRKMMLIKDVLEYTVPNVTLRNEILTDVLSFDLALSDVIKKTGERARQCRRNTTGECSNAHPYKCHEEGNQLTNKWCTVAKKILDRSGFSKKNSLMPVFLHSEEYFGGLKVLLNSTSQRTIAHTMALQFFLENAFFMNIGLRRKSQIPEDEAHFFQKKYAGQMSEFGRSQFCTVWACYRLPLLAAAAFYVDKSSNTEFRDEANEIFSNVKEKSLSIVEEMTWLEGGVKEIVKDVLSKMYFFTENYFSYVSDLSKVDALYREVQISDETFLANELESRKLATALMFYSLDNLEERGLYYAIPFRFEPVFEDSFPAIGMEVGNLVFPQFTTNRPRYANFAFLGYVIGHEIGHAITLELYGPFLKNKSEALETALTEKRECFENHFSGYEIFSTGIKTRGKVSFHEDAADYFGIRSAFESFKKYQETHGTEEMLPGLHFSNEQMFFILHAQNWCSAHTPKGFARYLEDAHSPPNVRILGMDKNFDAFSEAFNCATGTPMNPAGSKCQI